MSMIMSQFEAAVQQRAVHDQLHDFMFIPVDQLPDEEQQVLANTAHNARPADQPRLAGDELRAAMTAERERQRDRNVTNAAQQLAMYFVRARITNFLNAFPVIERWAAGENCIPHFSLT